MPTINPQSRFRLRVLELLLISFHRFFRPITLIVAKCWDPSPKNYFMVPRQEPVRRIDPSTWVAQTEAVMKGGGPMPPPPPGSFLPDPGRVPYLHPPGPASISTMSSTSSSLISSAPGSNGTLGTSCLHTPALKITFFLFGGCLKWLKNFH